jgi:thioredoxin 1
MSYATLNSFGNPEKEVSSIVPEVSNEFEREQYLRNFKVVVINNYASWCYPCKAIIPVYNLLYEQYNKKGICAILKEDVKLKIKNSRAPPITGVPCFHIYESGILKHTIMGGSDMPLVEETIINLVSSI